MNSKNLNNPSSYRRVVITGLGVISSIGIGKDNFWPNLIAGKSGISKITSFDTSIFDRHFGGEIKDFNPEDFIDKNKLKNIGRASQLAISASKLAINDANIDISSNSQLKVGVIIGTTMGEAQVLEGMDDVWVKDGHNSVRNALVTQYPVNSISSNVAIYLGLEGPNILLPTACAAGNYAIGYSYDLIKSGRIDMMLAGGADPFSKIAFVGFNRLFAMAPEKCQPYDKNRKGMLIGEGAGILVLEDYSHAIDRGAHIYAEILGYGLSCDGTHMTAPSQKGIVRVMIKALKETGITINEVDYISAHGTGTPSNDKAECAAINEVFDGRSKKVPVSSIKSMLGHTMGAASAIEAITCTLAVQDNVVPPTINFEEPDPECNIDCVPNKARKQEVNIALNNSYAFGGNNACLVLKSA